MFASRIARALLPLLVVLAAVPGSIDPVSAQQGPDFAVTGGWFYTQANGQDGARTGFAIIDDTKAPFYREFKRLGGVPVVGYPISDRFVWDGYETQAFQKLVFQWRASDNAVFFVNVFDKMNEAGKDNYLIDKRGVPKQKEFDEKNKAFDAITRDRLALLDKSPAIKKFYMTVPGDPVAYNGLPTSPIEEINNANVLRAQRVVLQEWKVNLPWARAGDVTLANGGDVAKEVGLLPENAIRPRNPDGTLPTGAATPSASPVTTRAPIATPTPLQPVSGPIALTLKVDSPLVSGGEGRIFFSVKDKDGKGVGNALVTILVHFPLGPNDTAYATDLSFITTTASDGNGAVAAKVPSSVPKGTAISIESTALYPPHSAHIEIGASIG